jgi:hypothetical protein
MKGWQMHQSPFDHTPQEDIPKKGVEVQVEKVFTFREDHIREILAEYLKREHQIDVLPEAFKFDITDSSMGGYREDMFVPAKINGVWIKVSQ